MMKRRRYATVISGRGIEHIRVEKITGKTIIGHVVSLAADKSLRVLPQSRRVPQLHKCVIVDRKFVVSQLSK
jgi:ribosomal protein S17